jgi:hypothetical protein
MMAHEGFITPLMIPQVMVEFFPPTLNRHIKSPLSKQVVTATLTQRQPRAAPISPNTTTNANKVRRRGDAFVKIWRVTQEFTVCFLQLHPPRRVEFAFLLCQLAPRLVR